MSAHTPGPWEACGFDVRTPLVDGGFLVASVDKSPLGADCSANAKLLAAAPDLLDALRELLAMAPAVAPGAGVLVGIEERHAECLKAARSAIKKAEGKA